LLEERRDDAFGLFQQAEKEVLGGHLLVAHLLRQPLPLLDGLLCLDREPVHSHWLTTFSRLAAVPSLPLVLRPHRDLSRLHRLGLRHAAGSCPQTVRTPPS